MNPLPLQPLINSPPRDSRPAPPDGYRWALLPNESSVVVDRHRDELIKFDDTKSKKIKKFEYKRLSNMKKRIRLLALMAGKRETPEVECSLFEVEIENREVWLKKDDQRQTKIHVKYEALSWSWGTGPAEYQILIREDGKRRRKKVSKELVWALKYLRLQDRDRTLWIDAICIDQGSVDEKNHQVQMMSEIYSNADRVCIWLGLDNKESSMAINFIKNEILQLEQFDTLCADESNSEKWQSLLLLMQREWFFRRWVVQEISLAKDAIIYCGSDEITWKDFSVAVELFVEVETATHRLSDVMKKDPRFYHVPGWFEYVSALGASLLVEATGMIFRYYKPDSTRLSSVASRYDLPVADNGNSSQINSVITTQSTNGDDEETDEEIDEESDREDEEVKAMEQNDGRHGGESGEDEEGGLESYPKTPTHVTLHQSTERRALLSLEYLVSKLSIFKATEPRDAIYSLLAIANDGYPSAEGRDSEISQKMEDVFSEIGGQKRFPVNYGRAYTDVCEDFIKFCISQSEKGRALDILCRPWAPEPKSGISPHLNVNVKKKTDDMLKWLKVCEKDRRAHFDSWQYVVKYFPEPRKNITLPSWIPKLEGAPFAMYSHAGIHIMKMGRKNADPLVGLPQASRNYDASQSMEVDESNLRFRKLHSQNAQCMFVKGFILETVREKTPPSQSGNIPIEWLKLSKWKVLDDPDKDRGPPEEFWRTIVADRGKDGRNPPYYYSRACKECIYKGGLISGSVNTSDLINNERNSIVAQFCRRVQAVIWNRSMIKTCRGNLGISRKEVRKGDLVCILYGCSVPVILRRKKKTEEQIQIEKNTSVHVLERVLQKCMSKVKAKEKRKESWKKLSEEGKEVVRGLLEKYKKKERMQNPPPKEEEVEDVIPDKVRTNYQRKVVEHNNYYYKFLGESYIHGMMDGEAVRRKITVEEESMEGWAGVKDAKIAEEREYRKKRNRRDAEGNVTESDDTGSSEDDIDEETERDIEETAWDKWRGEFLRDTIFELR